MHENLITFVLLMLLIAAIYNSVVFTDEKHLSFITMFGKLHSTKTAGLSFKIPFITKVDYVEYLGLVSHKVNLSLKTKDQVTFKLDLSVQYNVSNDINEAYKAVYNIENYEEEISNVAINAAISKANSIEVEDVYNQKEIILDEVYNELSEFFKDYGIVIKRVLSDEPVLPQELEAQANKVLSAKREKEAATHLAEAIRVKKVGEATADGESVKIRMEKLGEARNAFAEKNAAAIKSLTAAGVSSDCAAAFLNQIGEQDAIVSAARYGNSTIFKVGSNLDGSKQESTLETLLAASWQKNNNSTEDQDTHNE